MAGDVGVDGNRAARGVAPSSVDGTRGGVDGARGGVCCCVCDSCVVGNDWGRLEGLNRLVGSPSRPKCIPPLRCQSNAFACDRCASPIVLIRSSTAVGRPVSESNSMRRLRVQLKVRVLSFW